MFYLTHFFKSIFENPIKGLLIIFLPVALIIMSSSYRTLNNIGLQLIPMEKNESYFHVLIPLGQNHSSVRRKLSDLPEVNRVELMNKEKMQSKISQILTSLNTESDHFENFELELIGLKVIFNHGVELKSRKLIREYTMRLSDSSNVTLGKIKEAKKTTTFASVVKVLRVNWLLAFFGISLLGWLAIFMLFSQGLKNKFILLNSFQRRNSIEVKTLLVGIGLISLLSVLTTYLLGAQTSTLTLVLAVIFPVLALLGSVRRKAW
ncbi:MAG: hypothetical protein HOJ35_06160 [Bdellovibrionales bacterium]|nr:hypothetical protein [Bdellovibrionales bacterium]